ncbi:MAG: hypothetical protein WAX07_02785 [Candidatus Altiarchaeia archaeon]
MSKELSKHQKRYRRERKKRLDQAKRYHAANRDYILAWKAEYRKQNRKRLIEDKKRRRDEAKKYWHADQVDGAAKMAEELIINKVLPDLGFTEVLRPTTNFYFDALAKRKNGAAYAIEVSTYERKTLEKHRILFCKFFKLPGSVTFFADS